MTTEYKKRMDEKFAKITTEIVILHCGIPCTMVMKTIPEKNLRNEFFHHCVVCGAEFLDCGISKVEMEKSEIKRLQAPYLETS